MQIKPVHVQTEEQRRVFLAISRTAHDFEALGVGAINDACNARRDQLLASMYRAFLVARGCSGLPIEQARRELERPFALRDVPDQLLIDFSDGRSNVPGRPMAAEGSRILVYIDEIDVESLRCRSIWLSVEEVTLHEMLHVCGDTAADGMVRMNWCGVEAIQGLMAGVNSRGVPP